MLELTEVSLLTGANEWRRVAYIWEYCNKLREWWKRR